ncbi:uncharacterized protein LOC121388726 isoform X2 [Gigantopelta aegis]|nr:uncharacterized protein LOC121388726 isoform X2 [Gigantopelta aegis]XP_041376135.1 uncharacterized protein LOC121388726 isoform X2 [Gigantopelta aegis]XP_041376136.1 uncharacterized protein LOC121388726 isoform X2 [Gigantopelta aegis]XP_041376137.1 uncharacterized protein LOC121388726 isoform X2 [Gigantopelta aegis]XP_041376138.1 uncharacterized protein LOC121388726 isoform X2 [Gigantopelta aegis]
MTDVELTQIRPLPSEGQTNMGSSQTGLLNNSLGDGRHANGNSHSHPETETFISQPRRPKTCTHMLCKDRKRRLIVIVSIIVVVVLIASVCVGIYSSVNAERGRSSSGDGSEYTVVITNLPGATSQPLNPYLIAVTSFKSFPDPGDSKLFEVTFENRTTLTVNGHKTGDATVFSLYSVTIRNVSGDECQIRFKGQQSFASVMLPDGAIINYDWSHGFHEMEIKIFSLPSAKTNSSVPLSHAVSVDLGHYTTRFYRISKTIADVSKRPPLGDFTRDVCASRLPLKVTKCGGQYPYEGAFIRGILTSEQDYHQTTSALPLEKDEDECFSQSSVDNTPNFYLPLPNTLRQKESWKNTFCASGAKLFAQLCSAIDGTVPEMDGDMCLDVSKRVQFNHFNRQQDIFKSCYSVFHSLRLMCSSLGYSTSKSRTVNLMDFGWSESDAFYSLCESSQSLPNSVPASKINLNIFTYCPSVPPVEWYSQTIDLTQNHSNSLQSMLHLNCFPSPEVTYLYLGHKLSGVRSSSPTLDRLKHIFKICSVCSFHETIQVQVLLDESTCRNTCSDNDLLEIEPTEFPKEVMTYDQHRSVYCHSFLSLYDNLLTPVDKKCVSECRSKFTVEFKMFNSKHLYYHQVLMCFHEEGLSCKMTFGK